MFGVGANDCDNCTPDGSPAVVHQTHMLHVSACTLHAQPANATRQFNAAKHRCHRGMCRPPVDPSPAIFHAPPPAPARVCRARLRRTCMMKSQHAWAFASHASLRCYADAGGLMGRLIGGAGGSSPAARDGTAAPVSGVLNYGARSLIERRDAAT